MNLKNTNWKTIIPKLALVALVLSALAVLSQEEILIITGKRADKTVFYQISPNAQKLDFSDNRLTSLTLPAGLTNLEDLDLDGNQLTSLILPKALTSLKDLTLATNQLTSLDLPENLSVWRWLDLSGNQLTSLTLPAGLSSLVLDLSGNQLTSLTLPAGLRLRELDLRNNSIEQLLVPEGMNIVNLELHGFSKENIIRYVPDSVFLGLVIRREADGRVAIVFSGGVLQVAEGVSAEGWKDVLNAVSPFYINPAEASQGFFRVRSAR